PRAGRQLQQLPAVLADHRQPGAQAAVGGTGDAAVCEEGHAADNPGTHVDDLAGHPADGVDQVLHGPGAEHVGPDPHDLAEQAADGVDQVVDPAPRGGGSPLADADDLPGQPADGGDQRVDRTLGLARPPLADADDLARVPAN